MAPKRKSKVAWKIILGVILISVSLLLGLILYEWILEERSKYIRYTAFGIDIPENYSIHGIDVSKYQDVINWASVKDMKVENVKLGFVFIKATEGLNDEDDYFRRNWKEAKHAGMIRGAYHFFLATKNGKMQAENFIDKVDLKPGDLPPVLDVEQTYGVQPEKLKQRVADWLHTVEDYYKVKPIIYTNVDFYSFYLKGKFDDYPLWVAHYLQKEKPRISRDWTFWQHSEAGKVSGITSAVDFNVYNGDSTMFSALLIPPQPDVKNN